MKRRCVQANTVRAAKGRRRTPMAPDEGIQITAFSGALQFRGRGMDAAMARDERIVASLCHDPFPMVTVYRHELSVSKPILGETTSEPRDRASRESANRDGRSVLT